MTPVALPKPDSHRDWLLQRREGVGSSDASAILGLSSYESAYSLWEQKTGKVPLDPPLDDNTAELFEWGHRIEPLVREATAERLGLTITKPDHAFAHADRLWQRTNPDGLTPEGAIFEAKNVSYFMRDHWADQIPDHAEVQVHHSAAVLGLSHAIIAGLIGGNRLVIHQLEVNPTVVDIITEAEATFWEHVQSDTPPPLDGHVKTMDSLTREWAHKPGAKEVTAMDVEDYWKAWHEADQQEKAAKAAKKEALAHIASLMDGHDQLVTGRRVWAATQRTRIDLKKLTQDKPDLVKSYMTAAAFDLDRFKAEQPDLYRNYQGLSIRPKTFKEK